MPRPPPAKSRPKAARAAAESPAAHAFATLPTEERHPASADLDLRAPEDVVKLMLDEEVGAVRAARSRSAPIARAAQLVAGRLAAGGRLVYAGAGTSGRLGTLDAVECVPTFGVPPSRLAAVMAGGPGALTRSGEGAEGKARRAQGRPRRSAGGPPGAVCC